MGQESPSAASAEDVEDGVEDFARIVDAWSSRGFGSGGQVQTCSQTLGSVGFLVKRCVLYQSAVSGGPQAARTLALSSPKPARP